MSKPKSDSPTARGLALNALDRIEKEDSYADLVLNTIFLRHPELAARDRALITELTYGTLRWRLTLDWILTRLMTRRRLTARVSIRNILRLSLYQLIFLDRIPSRAAVHEAVKLARSVGGESAAGFVNAALRAWERRGARVEFPDPDKDDAQFLSVLFSQPLWLIARWRRFFSEAELTQILWAMNLPPPLTARVNLLKASLDEVLAAIPGAAAAEYAPEAVILPLRAMDAAQPFVEKGAIYFQDQGSQLVSRLLAPEPGRVYLDACAAPGGKATHLLELMRGRGKVYAVDIHRHRAEQLRRVAARLGTPEIIALHADFTASPPELTGIRFDGILLDVPCSGLGTLARHPELKWRRRPQDIHSLIELQQALLERAAAILPRGKPLVYSACSIDPEEGGLLIENWLTRHRDFYLDDPRRFLPPAAHRLVKDPGYLYTVPALDQMDGFFAARLMRRD